uniref:Reverse transcriptase domain-containing protein n=1 Tax=Tanacetum cinerariifolium TaxID=118510 RepID=A0A6L2KC60_TANCI|nr:reverse transcriptase domain-containing protein [Tanacetum cinerariifolium]
MGGHMIHRMYVDGGSSMKILYEHCFNRLRPEIKSQMVPATTSLTGFSGETIWPLGQLRLLVIIGDANHSTRAWMSFMIVRSFSPYNGIIGRPGIREIQAVPSTVYGMLKFTVEEGIVTICSTVLIPTECTSVITSSTVSKEERTRPDNFKGGLHPDFPDQEVAIEGMLSDKGRIELCSILKKNLDIFAWQPSDMTRVSRSVAEHQLTIREGYSPVRQKERGQAPERYHQIQLAEPDEEKIAFHTGQKVYCYTKMPFGLKNAGATYQRPMDKAFKSQIVRNIEVYVDDLVVKSYTEAEMLRDIKETFRTLRKINMKLNPKKCTFGLAEGVFLGYVVTLDGIKPCLDKTAAVLQLPSPRTIKEVQSLNGKLAREHNITYRPRTSVKGQILADFLIKMPDENPQAALMAETQQEPWTLFTNGSSCVDGSGAGLIQTNPEGIEFTYALRFQFAASNNEAEYEVLIAGLRIAAQMGVKNVHRIHQLFDKPSTIKQKQKSRCPEQNRVNQLRVLVQIAGPFPEGPCKVKFLIVDVDYFIKWIEAKAVVTITGDQVKKFVWDNIVCRFGLPGEIVSDNGKQFSDNPFKDWCDKLNITQRFVSIKHPQSNGLVERANQSLGEGIKARLGEGNKNWVEELPYVLWAHHLMIKSSHGDTSFSLTYGTEEVIPTEIGMPTYRTTAVDVVSNDEELRLNLDLLKERRERVATYEAKANNDASHAVAGGKLGPKWEGPYEVTEALGDGAYKLRSMDGTILSRTWNISNLKRCYL